LAEALDDGPDDVLGDIYMKSGMGSKAAGQFFTPFHLSELTAKLSIGVADLNSNDVIKINEPSCGGGGMIIAAAKVLHEAGIDYQQKMDVVAQDLDWKGVYMCYVQLSLLGIKAICVQGDTLREPYNPHHTEKSHMLFTPAKMGVLM
jgi:type I restriction-modification system DNA methylase subunit